jgi:hypothetical protein
MNKLLAGACAAVLVFAWAGASAQAQDEPAPEGPEAPAPETPEEGPERAPEGPEPPPGAGEAEDDPAALLGVPYFPLEEGRRWHYRVQFRIEPAEGGDSDAGPEDSSEGDHYLDVYVAGAVQVGEKQAVALEWKLDQALAQRSYFRVEGGVLFCLKRLQGSAEHVKEFTLSPPQRFLPSKPAVGEEWTWTGLSGPASGTQRFKVLREEELRLPVGTFKTLVVESEFTGEDDSRGKTTRWLAPGVGIVKEVSEVRTPKQVFRSEGSLLKFEKP